MTERLEFTGERFVPGTPGEIWYEHWHRYHFATRLAAGKRVLDVACGEGYGTALLADRAASAVGVDVSPEAIAHARAAYADRVNADFVRGDCAALPFPDGTFDLVVSFETIEHIVAQERFLDEALRVLHPEGILLLSCPNKREYSDRRGLANPFHVRELYRDELEAMLHARFPQVAWYGQQPSFFSVIWPEAGANEGEIFEVAAEAPRDAQPGHARPQYFLAMASRSPAALAGTSRCLSVLADRDEWVHQDYEKVTASLHGAHERGNTLERELVQWQRHHDEAVSQRDALIASEASLAADRDRLHAKIEGYVRDAAALREGLASARATIAARDASVAAADAWRVKLEGDIATLHGEVARRSSVRWWIGAWLARAGLRRT